MNNQHTTRHKNTFKQVDLGNTVVLNNDYRVANERMLQVEAIVKQTMAHAESESHKTIASAQEQAQQIIAAATEKAAQIIEEEGNQQRDAILKQGYEEGYEAGITDGREEIATSMAEQINLADLILEKVFEAKQLLIHKNQSQLIELFQYVLKLVLLHELKTQPEQIAGLLENAAERIQITGTAKILLNPEVYQSLKETAPQVLEALTTSKHLQFHPDTNCAPDEMYLETADCSFDISPENQIKILMASIQPYLETSAELQETLDVIAGEEKSAEDQFQIDQETAALETIQASEISETNLPERSSEMEIHEAESVENKAETESFEDSVLEPQDIENNAIEITSEFETQEHDLIEASPENELEQNEDDGEGEISEPPQGLSEDTEKMDAPE